ncbi:MAG: 6-phospho-beta-glucosidase [Actinobacteria bacterium]|nr:6-phospho-beta-glucosidase [Actinomycetota bacterium]
MKLTVLGAGIRTPLLLSGLARRAEALGLEEVVLHDCDLGRLETMAAFGGGLCEEWGAAFRVRAETDSEAALEGADFVFSAIRVGGEAGRIIDEQVPLRHGIIGQETTGPGGFAMALRTIPVMIDYARTIERVAPHAWLINFTNPAGLITQALKKHTEVKVIGICDTPTAMKRTIARVLGVPGDDVGLDYFGLNHLGWVRRVLVNGADRLPELLDRFEELQTAGAEWAPFDPGLVRDIEMLPNEYLYYFYYREQALEHIRRSGNTRGQQLETLNRPLWEELSKGASSGDWAQARAAYELAMSTRRSTYMARESGRGDPDASSGEELFEGEGYEGLAMAVMTSIRAQSSVPLIVNVPANGAVAGFADDVLELPCLVDGNGATPLAAGAVPSTARALMEPVKTYERLTVEAAVARSYSAATQALVAHPLVGSYRLATAMLDEYLSRHGLLGFSP